jgi:hypothetical protein
MIRPLIASRGRYDQLNVFILRRTMANNIQSINEKTIRLHDVFWNYSIKYCGKGVIRRRLHTGCRTMRQSHSSGASRAAEPCWRPARLATERSALWSRHHAAADGST